MINIIKIFVDRNSILDKVVVMIVDGHDPLHSKVIDVEELQWTLHQTIKELSFLEKEIVIHGAILEQNYFD
ncbi:hypothetical protein ACFVHQ_21725 [Actinomycetes bacterium NPDC127524]